MSSSSGQQYGYNEPTDGTESYLFKIVLVGDSGVGKTNLASRFAHNEFHADSRATIGVEFRSKALEIDGHEIKAQIWDTSGQERYRAVTSVYYRGAFGALLAYDISRKATFDSVQQWLKELRCHAETLHAVMLVGNKKDLEHLRAVATEKGEDLAKREGLCFMETSALDTTNVDEAFESLIAKIYESVSKRHISTENNYAVNPARGQRLRVQQENPQNSPKQRSGCCS